MGLKEEVLKIVESMADQSIAVDESGELQWPYRYGRMLFHYADCLRQAVLAAEINEEY